MNRVYLAGFDGVLLEHYFGGRSQWHRKDNTDVRAASRTCGRMSRSLAALVQGYRYFRAMRLAIREAIEQGIPTYAECGGLMYLGETLVSFNGQAWPDGWGDSSDRRDGTETVDI